MLQKFVASDLGSSRELELVQQHLNRLFSLSNYAHSEYPLLNVWTSEDGAIARAELPGLDPSEVEISLVNDTVTVQGERRCQSGNENQLCHRQERRFGQFSRSLQLPFRVDAEGVQAKFFDGVLEITLPRAESDKARKINVITE